MSRPVRRLPERLTTGVFLVNSGLSKRRTDDDTAAALHLRIPEMRAEGSLRPTQQGITVAKDVWMFGIGLSLLADDER